MTALRQALLDDAAAAGFAVNIDSTGHTTIIRRAGRWRKPEGLVIFADGTAVDAAVDLGEAKGLRSYRAMRAVLGI